MAAPNSFRDPFWSALATKVSSKQGLPPGLLLGILTNGERSNADQVSEVGAKTPFQVTPTTRNLVLKRDGVDAYLSPENAAEVAGIVLKDGLNWAKARTDNPDTMAKLAAGYYHGGGDTKNWGPRTESYVMRVGAGLPAARDAALTNDFAKFMAANPATPAGGSNAAVAPPAPQPVPASDPLTRDFAKFMAEGGKPRTGAEAVPTAAGAAGLGYTSPADVPATAAPGVLDQAWAGVQAGANTLAASIGGGAGALYGALEGVGENVGSLLAGQQPRMSVEQNSARRAQQFTPELPQAMQTQLGRDYTEGVGNFIAANAPAVGPLGPELSAIGGAMAPVARAAGDVTRAAPEIVRANAPILADKVRGATQAVADRARALMPGGDAPAATATPGTMGSVGAAGTDVALMRRTAAESLPVPLQLTKGMESRDFAQLQFEKETAKNPTVGAPLRARVDELNQKMTQNLDAFIDETGARAPDLRSVGVAVDDVVSKAAANDKNEIRVAYTKAKKSEEGSRVVDPASKVKIGEGETEMVSSPIDYINSKPKGLATTALVDHAREYAIRLGIATEQDGKLVAKPASVRKMEEWRSEIKAATPAADDVAIRDATILKKLIDGQTESVAGPLFREARRLRARFAENYERHAAIADITKNRPGTADRKVALEDIHQRMILDGSLDDVRQVRRVLQRSGPDGHQAWKELQGQTLSHIRDQAFSNAARDQLGNAVLSFAKLDKTLKNLDASGKLDFVFGKKGAEQLRTVRDVAQDVYTSPPGSVNTSNTASVLAGLMDLGLTAHTGLPVPIATGARMLVRQLKDRQLAKRVNEALNGRP